MHSPCSGNTNRFLKKRFGVERLAYSAHSYGVKSGLTAMLTFWLTFRKGQKTFENYMDCKFYLENLFGRKVDLVMKTRLKTRFRPYILGEVIYA